MEGTTHPVETSVLVDNLDDCHRTHKEEERRAGLAEIALYSLAEREVWKMKPLIAKGKEWPAYDTHKDGHGGLVDFCHCLKRYEGIANDKGNDNNSDG